MKAKEKREIKVTLKGIITFLIFTISLLYMVVFYNYFFGRNNVYATEVVSHIENVKISEAEEIKIEDMMRENIEEERKEKYITQEFTLEYITKYRNNISLPKGTMQVVQEGREGKQEITIKKI